PWWAAATRRLSTAAPTERYCARACGSASGRIRRRSARTSTVPVAASRPNRHGWVLWIEGAATAAVSSASTTVASTGRLCCMSAPPPVLPHRPPCAASAAGARVDRGRGWGHVARRPHVRGRPDGYGGTRTGREGGAS